MLPPSYYKRLNNKGKTAHQVFTEQHANLRIKGEKWMKDVAIPCTIIAALVLIVSFAASIIFPCIKNCEKALPISSKPDFFISLFIFSNIISLSTSFVSLLAFVSILPCRDLQLVLPERLLCGFLTLYAALEALMLSFGCALYFVLKDNEMVFYFVFLVVVLPILAFQHWRGLFINHLFSLVKKKKTMLWRQISMMYICSILNICSFFIIIIIIVCLRIYMLILIGRDCDLVHSFEDQI